MTITTDENLGHAFVDAMHNSWLAEGPAVIERVRREHAAAYLRFVASVLPRDLLDFFGPFLA